MLVMELLPVINRNMRIEITDINDGTKTCAPVSWLDPKYLEREIYEITFREGTIVIDLKGEYD